MVVNGRPLKRMKRRVTADLYNFLTFLSSGGDDMTSSFSPPRGPFRSNIKSFLAEHAMLPPPSSLFPHLLTWQISFRAGDLAEEGGVVGGGFGAASPAVVFLDVVEEDVARSRSVYCDQCRVVGWSGNPVCTKRYHFIIKSDGNSIGGYHKPCTCCGDILHVSESRCKTCFHVTTEDDVEDWVYHQLEDTTHLLHGVVHANGYGHLLRVNGREGGSRVLSGRHIMDFWDRLCRALGARKISVMDVSKKFGMEYRLLHAIMKGRPWYGDWGYEFGAGSFALTHDAYNSAVETLSSLSLSNFLPQGQKPCTSLQEKISFYQSLSDRELVNTRDLFSYLISLIHSAHKAPSRSDYFGKKPCTNAFGISLSWSQSDIKRAQGAMFRVLRAVSGSNWVSRRALRGSVCKVAPPELLEHCLDQLGGKSVADGLIVCTRYNPDSGALEYRIEPGKPETDDITSSIGSSAITCPTEPILVRDLRFFYEHMLHPRTMQSFVPETISDVAISSASKLLDCKQFVKNYKPEKNSLVTDPLGTCLSCEVELEDDASCLPSELIILPPDATLSDLKHEVSKAFQDVYLMCRRFQVEELVGYSGVDDSTQVKLLLGSTGSVRVRGRCLGKNGLTKFRRHMANDSVNAVSHDLSALLSSQDRDFLVRNNGDKVNISDLNGKIVGLYFSASWCGPCRNFTPTLVEVYEELSPQGDLEVVFISSDRDDESFTGYFSKMPWLAIPFSDVETRKRLKELFKVRGIPNLVFLDGNGKVSSDNGVMVIREYGAEGYPFSEERISFFKEQEENAKKNQTLTSVLVSSSRDYVISNDGAKIPVADLERKTVGLYFSAKSHPFCAEFTPKLVDVFKKIKEKGENFEIVLISLDHEEEEFKESVKTMPWFAVPFKDKTCDKLVRYFELRALPTLVIIGQDGKTLNSNVAELIEEHGVEAYPFSPEKLVELDEIKKKKLELQTLETLLVHGDKDFVIEKSGSEVPVSELVGKHVLLYFSAEWCPPCRAFLPKLIEAYHEIKAKDNAFEVVFISSDKDQSSFDKFYAEMPWLALPYGDGRKPILQRKFKIRGIPAAIVIGPSGKTVTTEARKHLSAFGAEAFPFTEEHVKKLEEKLEEMAKTWPEKVKHEIHEHELTLSRRNGYGCDGCKEVGSSWSYLCKQCDFDLHPKCALKEKIEAREVKQGYTCDGDVCRRA